MQLLIGSSTEKMSGKHRGGHNVVLLDAQNGRERNPEVIAKAAVMIIIYQETVYTDISLGKLFLC